MLKMTLSINEDLEIALFRLAGKRGFESLSSMAETLLCEVLDVSASFEKTGRPLNIQKATSFLEGLRSLSPLFAAEVRRRSEEEGIPRRTFVRARLALGDKIKIHRHDIHDRRSPWVWTWVEQPTEEIDGVSK
jgi:hypothetical protein